MAKLFRDRYPCEYRDFEICIVEITGNDPEDWKYKAIVEAVKVSSNEPKVLRGDDQKYDTQEEALLKLRTLLLSEAAALDSRRQKRVEKIRKEVELQVRKEMAENMNRLILESREETSVRLQAMEVRIQDTIDRRLSYEAEIAGGQAHPLALSERPTRSPSPSSSSSTTSEEDDSSDHQLHRI